MMTQNDEIVTDPATSEKEPETPQTPQTADDVAHSDTQDAPANGDDSPNTAPTSRAKRLETEGDIAADFLEDLLDIADFDGDIDLDVDGNRAAVSIVGAELSELVGKEGEVLEALQELTRLAVLRETGERSRLMLDVGGHRANRRQELVELTQQVVKDVTDTGESVKLQPMTPFERKVVHDAVAVAGLGSESEGVEPHRCVVVLPSS